MKPTKEQLETTAKTLQMLHHNYQGHWDQDEALYCLFGYMIGTFGKLYDDEEELLSLIGDMQDFQNGTNPNMFSDLVEKEREEARPKDHKQISRENAISDIKYLLNKLV